MVSGLVASEADGRASCLVSSILLASQGGLDGPPPISPSPVPPYTPVKTPPRILAILKGMCPGGLPSASMTVHS